MLEIIAVDRAEEGLPGTHSEGTTAATPGGYAEALTEQGGDATNRRDRLDGTPQPTAAIQKRTDRPRQGIETPGRTPADPSVLDRIPIPS